MRFLPKMLAGVLSALLLATACVNTELDSIPSPQGHPLPLHRVLVLVDVGDIGTRLAAENAAAPEAPTAGVPDTTLGYVPATRTADPYAIQNQGTAVAVRGTGQSASRLTLPTVFLPSYRYLPPLEQWGQMTGVQKDSLLEADTVDAVMVIEPTGAGATETAYGSSTTKCTSVDATTGACRSTRTSSSGGTVAKPWLSTSIRVIAVDNKRILWSATANSGGGALSRYGVLAASVVTRAVKRLHADGFID